MIIKNLEPSKCPTSTMGLSVAQKRHQTTTPGWLILSSSSGVVKRLSAAALWSVHAGSWRQLTAHSGMFAIKTRNSIFLKLNWRRHSGHINGVRYNSGIDIKVVLGAHDVTQTPGSTEKTYNVAPGGVISHPDWIYGMVENDIALIQLPEDVPLSGIWMMWQMEKSICWWLKCQLMLMGWTAAIQPSRLPYSDDGDQVGDPVTLLGWGNFSSTRTFLH